MTTTLACVYGGEIAIKKAAKQNSLGGRTTVVLTEIDGQTELRKYFWEYWNVWYPAQGQPKYVFADVVNFYVNGQWSDEI